jgi:hypothetical protein
MVHRPENGEGVRLEGGPGGGGSAVGRSLCRAGQRGTAEAKPAAGGGGTRLALDGGGGRRFNDRGKEDDGEAGWRKRMGRHASVA